MTEYCWNSVLLSGNYWITLLLILKFVCAIISSIKGDWGNGNSMSCFKN